MIICPSCSKRNFTDAEVCSGCGMTLIRDIDIHESQSKKCPYCAEEIQDEAIYCRFCHQELVDSSDQYDKKAKTTRKIKPNPILLVIAVGVNFLIISYALLAVIPAIIKDIAEQRIQYSSDDLCTWYSKTQILHSDMISGLDEYKVYSQAYDLYPLDEQEIYELVEFAQISRLNYNEFIRDWKDLGSHSDGKVFWEKELESIEDRIYALNLMESWLKFGSESYYSEGGLYFTISYYSMKQAESAMEEIRLKCLSN